VLIAIGALLLFRRAKEETGATEGDRSKKTLLRSRKEKMVGGVCGGLADYFELDVSVIRVLWVIATVVSIGMGILVYIVLFFVLPEESENVNDNSMTV
jgi:phage shock protein PspC (stress-responsive transcriptional regulator)